MQRLFNKINDKIQHIYKKAEQRIEKPRDYPLSQNMLNATLQKYVTEKVSAIQDFHADLFDDWARLFLTLNFKGIETDLSVDVRLQKMYLDADVQLLVFEQLSNTQVISATFNHPLKKMGFNLFVYVYHRILNKDPLGMILERFEVVKVQPNGLLNLDLNQYLQKSESALDTLKKLCVTQGIVQPGVVMVSASINLEEILPWNKETNLLMTTEEYQQAQDEYHYRQQQAQQHKHKQRKRRH